MLNEMEPAEARLWALRGIAQHPQLVEEFSGEYFIPSQVSYSIFTAIRSLFRAKLEVTPWSIYVACGGGFWETIGLVDLFCPVSVSERMARVYVEKLAESSER